MSVEEEVMQRPWGKQEWGVLEEPRQPQLDRGSKVRRRLGRE